MSSSGFDTDELLSIAVALRHKKRKKRSKWSKSWLLKRSALSHDKLLEELRLREPQDWFNYWRMDGEAVLLRSEEGYSIPESLLLGFSWLPREPPHTLSLKKYLSELLSS